MCSSDLWAAENVSSFQHWNHPCTFSAAQYQSVWRNLVDTMRQVPGNHFTFLWNPTLRMNSQPSGRSWLDTYPGDAYVDWVGVTGYFAATSPDTFDGVYGPTMQEIRGFTARPFIIAETSVQTGPDAAAAAQSLVSGVRQRPDVLGFAWFDYDKASVDWRLESRPPVRAAIAAELAGLRLIDVRRQ